MISNLPESEARLSNALNVLRQLSPEELAVIEERLAAQKQIKEQPAPDDAADLFGLPFAHYLALSDKERDAIALRAYQTLRTWIDAKLEERKAEWILVCGGEVIESSPTLQNYPSREKLMQTGQQRGLVPFVFVRGPLIEESGWSVLPRGDFYPTIRLSIAAAGTSTEHLPNTGIELTADFDSGSPGLFMNYDLMMTHQIVDNQPIDQPHLSAHLGQAYRFHILPLLIGVRSEDGTVTAREFSVLCVRNWRLSPLCLINPNREALAGRNLLIEIPLRLELDGAKRTTRVAPAQA